MGLTPVLPNLYPEPSDEERYAHRPSILHPEARPQDSTLDAPGFPTVHVLSLVLGLLVSVLTLVPLSSRAVVERPGPTARPTSPSAGRLPANLPGLQRPSVTVYIVDSQRVADEIEAEAAVASAAEAPDGPAEPDATREYVIAGTREADAQIESLLDLYFQLNSAPTTQRGDPTYQVVDMRGRN